MKPWRATDLLEAWDAGQGLHAIDRALILLAFAYPLRPWADLCALPLGERNRLLLEARAQSFGPLLDIVSECPSCAEQVEFEFCFPLADFAPTVPREISTTLAHGGGLSLRLPNSWDLAAVAEASSPEEAQAQLLVRCVIEPGTHADAATAAERRELAESLSRAIEAHDPLASISFPLQCTGCREPWSASFDPVEYIWREVAQRVRVLVSEVDALARAYCWSEREILSLTPARRRLYLEQVRA
jgi:hypothetical protein